MSTLQQPIAPEAITNLARIGRFETLTIFNTKEMVQQTLVSYVDETGKPLLEKALEDESLTDEQRNAFRLKYADRLVTRTTEGAFCDAAGNVVAADAEGAITQLQFFQSLSFGQVMALTGLTEADSFAAGLYALLGAEITKINERGGF